MADSWPSYIPEIFQLSGASGVATGDRECDDDVPNKDKMGHFFTIFGSCFVFWSGASPDGVTPDVFIGPKLAEMRSKDDASHFESLLSHPHRPGCYSDSCISSHTN
jgi:hypothetical protein